MPNGSLGLRRAMCLSMSRGSRSSSPKEFERTGSALPPTSPKPLTKPSLSSSRLEPHRDRMEQAIAIIKDLYRPLYLIETPFVVTDIPTAEMIKYASNAFLATKISFINEIATVCERVGADVQMVAKGMGLDNRIGSKFLHAGPGFGGSCFPKDLAALVQTGERVGYPMRSE